MLTSNLGWLLQRDPAEGMPWEDFWKHCFLVFLEYWTVDKMKNDSNSELIKCKNIYIIIGILSSKQKTIFT
jgi:hypothetical protein